MTRTINKIVYEYNSMFDILYIKLFDAYETYVDEQQPGILVNHDYTTRTITGVDIWDFKKRIERHETVNLPFIVDLRKIYTAIN